MTGKPAIDALGIDVSDLDWRRSGDDAAAGLPGAVEVAMADRQGGGTWVLVRVAADPDRRELVYDEHEWACFLDGVRNGEFDLTE
jgi:hypothetical protein